MMLLPEKKFEKGDILYQKSGIIGDFNDLSRWYVVSSYYACYTSVEGYKCVHESKIDYDDIYHFHSWSLRVRNFSDKKYSFWGESSFLHIDVSGVPKREKQLLILGV